MKDPNFFYWDLYLRIRNSIKLTTRQSQLIDNTMLVTTIDLVRSGELVYYQNNNGLKDYYLVMERMDDHKFRLLPVY